MNMITERRKAWKRVNDRHGLKRKPERQPDRIDLQNAKTRARDEKQKSHEATKPAWSLRGRRNRASGIPTAASTMGESSAAMLADPGSHRRQIAAPNDAHPAKAVWAEVAAGDRFAGPKSLPAFTGISANLFSLGLGPGDRRCSLKPTEDVRIAVR